MNWNKSVSAVSWDSRSTSTAVLYESYRGTDRNEKEASHNEHKAVSTRPC